MKSFFTLAALVSSLFYLAQAEEPLCCPLGWFQVAGASSCYGKTKDIAGSGPKVKVAKRLTAMCKAEDSNALPYHFNHDKAKIAGIIAMLGADASNVFHTTGIKRRLFWTFETFSGRKPSKKLAKTKKGIARKHPCLLYVVSRNRHVPSKCNVKQPGLCTSPFPNTPCPIDGVYGAWGAWGTVCSSTCAGGTIERTRLCDSPAPEFGGADCTSLGVDTEVQPCNDEIECPIHGGWGEWIADDDCDLWCGTSTQTRYRNCDNPAPNSSGDACVGDDEDDGTFPCEGRVCPYWTEWSPTCYSVCGAGVLSNNRDCRYDYYFDDYGYETVYPEYCIGDVQDYDNIYDKPYPESYQYMVDGGECDAADATGSLYLESCDSEHGKVIFYEIGCSQRCDDLSLDLFFDMAPTGGANVTIGLHDSNPVSLGASNCNSNSDCDEEHEITPTGDNFVFLLTSRDGDGVFTDPGTYYLLIGIDGTDAAIPAATYGISFGKGFRYYSDNVVSVTKLYQLEGSAFSWTVPVAA